MKREIDRSRDVDDEEEGDIDDESEVELDGNDQLNLELDLDSEHNDKTLPKQVLSLRILIFYTPPHQLSFFKTFHN